MSEREILCRLIDACAQAVGGAARGDDYGAQSVRDIVASAKGHIQAIADDAEREEGYAVGLPVAIKEAFLTIHLRFERKDAPPDLATGFASLDPLLGGFMAGDLIALAAAPGAGKSTLAAQIAAHCAIRNKQAVYVFSMKRAATEYVMRLIAALGSIDRQHLRDGGIQDEEWPRVSDTISLLNNDHIVIDASATQSIFSLRSRMRAAQRLRGLKLAVIDSLELLDKPERAADLRIIARELNVAVLVLTQLRGAVDAHTHLRDTALEDHADAVLLLDRDQTGAGEKARLVVARNRNGRTGEVQLRYLAPFARFEEGARS